MISIRNYGFAIVRLLKDLKIRIVKDGVQIPVNNTIEIPGASITNDQENNTTIIDLPKQEFNEPAASKLIKFYGHY